MEIDHVIPLSRNGSDDPSNLRTTCAPCHERKTFMEMGGRPRQAVGIDGWPVEA